MSSFSEILGCESNMTLNRNLSTEMDSSTSNDSNKKSSEKNTKKKSTKKKSKNAFGKKTLGQEIILLPKIKKKVSVILDIMSRNVKGGTIGVAKKYIKPTRQEKKEKKFWETVEKMHLKTCKTIVIGIGYDLFQCSIARISPNYVHLFLKGRYYSTVKDADRYSLKNLKIMMEQGVYLTQLFAERAFNKSRSKRVIYNE